MSVAAVPSTIRAVPPVTGPVLAGGMLLLAVAAALLAGWAPIQFSIVTVFLFAGPHNWLEFRYFLARLPGRWGRLRGFFLLSFAGILGLTGVFAVLAFAADAGAIDPEAGGLLFPAWNTLLLLWIASLVHWRSRQNPRREWGWIWPLTLFLIALAWQYPQGWGLLIVYLHPLMAFWLLDRELRRSKPEWRPT